MKRIFWVKIFLEETSSNRLFQESAALAFFTILSAIPLSVVLMFLIKRSHLFYEGLYRLKEFIFSQISDTGARDFISAIFDPLSRNVNKFGSGLIGFFALLIFLLIGSGYFHALTSSINKIFHSVEKPKRLIRIIFFWVFIIVFPLLIGVSIRAGFLRVIKPVPFFRIDIGSFLFNTIIFLAIYLCYRYLPSVRVSFLSSIVGTAVTFSLFYLFKVVFHLYVAAIYSKSIVAKIYGGIALMPVLFIWIYYIWIIFFIGVEIVYLLENKDHFLIKGFIPLRPLTPALAIAGVVALYEGDGNKSIEQYAFSLAVDPEQLNIFFIALYEKNILICGEDCFYPKMEADELTIEMIMETYKEIMPGKSDIGGFAGEFLDYQRQFFDDKLKGITISQLIDRDFYRKVNASSYEPLDIGS